MSHIPVKPSSQTSSAAAYVHAATPRTPGNAAYWSTTRISGAGGDSAAGRQREWPKTREPEVPRTTTTRCEIRNRGSSDICAAVCRNSTFFCRFSCILSVVSRLGDDVGLFLWFCRGHSSIARFRRVNYSKSVYYIQYVTKNMFYYHRSHDVRSTRRKAKNYYTQGIAFNLFLKC